MKINPEVTIKRTETKFYTMKEYEQLLKEMGCEEADFNEREKCVFSTVAACDGEEGVICFY